MQVESSVSLQNTSTGVMGPGLRRDDAKSDFSVIPGREFLRANPE